MIDTRTDGQVGFDRYGDEGRPEPWKTFDGRDMPRWDAELPHMVETRRRWEAAAAEIVRVRLAHHGLELLPATLDKLERIVPLHGVGVTGGPGASAIVRAKLAELGYALVPASVGMPEHLVPLSTLGA